MKKLFYDLVPSQTQSRLERAEQNHWSECGRAASVASSRALGRPHRSVPALSSFRYMGRHQSSSRWSRIRQFVAGTIAIFLTLWLDYSYLHLHRTERSLLLLFCFAGSYFVVAVFSLACARIVSLWRIIFPARQTRVHLTDSKKHGSKSA